MADPKATVYDADPHTQAKHRILEEYLKRWMPILARQSELLGRKGRLLYVDGFAGAGEYTGNTPGSPLVAIHTAIRYGRQFTVPIVIKFIELRPDRTAHLKRLVDGLRPQIELATNLFVDDPAQGDCEAAILDLIDEHERNKRRLGPALFFLDQFGYSSFSMNLVGRILKHEVCEVFSYLNWNLLHPFITDQTKWAGIARAFGGDEWRQVIGLNGQEKEDRFRDIYMRALRDRAGAKYCYPFAMRDHHHRIIYWLFFCTNSLRGLEEMKKAMWAVDKSGGFEFSDKHASSAGSLFTCDDNWLADTLFRDLDGREMTVGAVKEHVLVFTPCYSYKSALGQLERDDKLEVTFSPVKRRRNEFPDEKIKVRFRQKIKQKQLSIFGE